MDNISLTLSFNSETNINNLNKRNTIFWDSQYAFILFITADCTKKKYKKKKLKISVSL